MSGRVREAEYLQLLPSPWLGPRTQACMRMHTRARAHTCCGSQVTVMLWPTVDLITHLPAVCVCPGSSACLFAISSFDHCPSGSTWKSQILGLFVDGLSQTCCCCWAGPQWRPVLILRPRCLQRRTAGVPRWQPRLKSTTTTSVVPRSVALYPDVLCWASTLVSPTQEPKVNSWHPSADRGHGGSSSTALVLCLESCCHFFFFLLFLLSFSTLG